MTSTSIILIPSQQLNGFVNPAKRLYDLLRG